MQTAQSPQAANELDILHQGHLEKAAKSLEESAPYEDALIAVRELLRTHTLSSAASSDPSVETSRPSASGVPR